MLVCKEIVGIKYIGIRFNRKENSVCKREYYVANRIKVVLNMFTVGTDVLGCFKSDRLWFLLKGRNQSFSYLPISTSVGSYCQHMRARISIAM